MNKAVFLTGSTGFIGGALLRQLLASGRFERFYVLVRGTDPQKRFSDFYTDFSGRELDKITVFKGDITRENCGLSDDAIRILKHEAGNIECFHAAADIRFGEEHRDEIFNINMGGTRNLLNLLNAVIIPRLHYVSTAYVCGDRKGEVKEDELDRGQKFRNPYEESKFQAEKIIQAYGWGHHIIVTIYRPSIVIGDSLSGVTNSFAGYYSYMRTFAFLKREISYTLKKQQEVYRKENIYLDDDKLHLPLVVWGNPRATINLVCIDYAVNLIVRLSTAPNSGGLTFHVVNPCPPKAQQLLEDSMAVLGISGVKMLDMCEDADGQEVVKKLVTRTPIIDALAKKIRGEINKYVDYSEVCPTFSMANIERILGEIPQHPLVDRALIEKLLQYAVENNFGRKRKN